MVADILEHRRYKTEIMQRHKRKTDNPEIDVIDVKDKIKLAVECKNYKHGNKIGIKEIRNFT